MELHRIHTYFGRLLAAWIAVAGLLAAEHHGTVKSGGLPVPGASVTAIKGDKKLYTTTDENGRYSFADLADGTWTIEVEMLGFAKVSNEVGVAFDAPAPEWNLKFLSMSAITAAAGSQRQRLLLPQHPRRHPLIPPLRRRPHPPSQRKLRRRPRPRRPHRRRRRNRPPAALRPAARDAARMPPTADGPPYVQSNGFQRVDVNSSGDLPAAPDTGLAADEAADLSNSADPSLLVNGSVSRGLDMPQQNDWFGGPGGRMDGMGGGPGGMNGMNGMNPGGGDGAGGRTDGRTRRTGRRWSGRRTRRPRRRYARRRIRRRIRRTRRRWSRRRTRWRRAGAGRGGPMGRAGVASFGNGRRDRRMQYNGNLGVTLDNSVWDARAFSINGQETPKPAYAKARATMVFGGPLKIPKLLDGTKGTFTLNYQLSRTRNGTSSTQTMPTLLERSGDFSQSVGPQGPVTIYDPLSGSPFPGNVIPTNRISSASLGLLQYYPRPQRARL